MGALTCCGVPTAKLLFCVSLLVILSSVHAASTTGYDIDITYPDFNQAREAVERFDAFGSGYLVTGVHGTTVSVYTTSQALASSLSKRSDPTVIRVRPHFAAFLILPTFPEISAKLGDFWNVEPLSDQTCFSVAHCV